MLKRPKKKIREKFLKDFTEQLIEAKSDEIMKDLKSQQQKIRVKRARDVEKLKKKYIKPQPRARPRPRAKPKAKPSTKTKPKPKKRLPRPVPVSQKLVPLNVPTPHLDLGKLNELIADQAVQSIECPGSNKKLIIKKNNQTMKSDIKLTKQEITHVVTEFSEKARIPLMEGMLRARVGNLQISAVVSKLTSSRFIITRIYVPAPAAKLPALQQPTQLRAGQMMPYPMTRAPPVRPMPRVRRPFMPGASPRSVSIRRPRKLK